MIGCAPRERLIPLQRERIFHRERRGRRMDIRVEPFTRPSATQRRELVSEAARIAHTYSAEPALEVI